MLADAQTVRSLRIVVRPHLNCNVIDMLADDIVKACDFLKKSGGNVKPPALHTHKTAPKC
jgi:glutamate decarboxylase